MREADATVVVGTGIDTTDYKHGLKKMESDAARFSANVASLTKKALGGIGLGLGAKELAQMAGTWTDLESRVKLASRGMADTSQVMARLKNIADTAYSSLEKTAEAFLSNATTLNALGYTMEQQLDLADAMTNALVVSGAKGDQFNQVMDAVSRSLATGKLSGEELNMVLKYGGAMAEGLAGNLGVTVNELREMGTQGKLTADVVSKGLIANMEKWRAQAEEMPATVSDAFTRLRNEMLSVAADLNQDWGFEAAAVKGIDAIKDNLAGIASYADEAAVAVAAIYSGRHLKNLIDYIKQQLTQATATRDAAVASQNGAKADQAAAAAKVQATEASIAKTKADLASAVATQDAVTASYTRIAVEKQLAALDAQLVVQQNALAAANTRVAASASKLSTATAAMNKMKAAASGIMGLFGGPWGLALAAGGSAFYALYRHADKARESFAQFTSQLDETNNKIKLTSVELAELSRTKVKKALGEAKDELKAMGQEIEKFQSLGSVTVVLQRGFTKTTLREDSKAVSAILNEVYNGAISAEEGFRRLAEAEKIFGNTQTIDMARAALGNLGQKIKEVAGLQEELDGANKKVADSYWNVVYSAEDLAKALKLVNENEIKPPKNLEDAAKLLIEATKGTQAFADAQAAAEKEAIRVALAMLREAASLAELTRDLETFARLTEQIGKIESQLASGPKKTSSGGKSAADKAKEQAQAYTEMEIALAKVNNQFERVRELEAAQEVERFAELVQKAGLKGEEAAKKIAEYSAAVEKKVNTDHLQEQLQFYEELRNVMPAAGAEFEAIRAQLIELEAEQLRAIGIGQEFIDVWKRQSELRASTDFMSGLTVAMQDYIATLTPAAQAQDLFNVASQSTSDALFNVVTGAESASEAFGNMAKSIVDQLIKIMIQMYVMKPIVEWMSKSLGFGGMGSGALSFIRGGFDIPRFSSGGYTGSGSPSDVAGVVHKNEYVLNAATTSALGVGTLDAMNSATTARQLQESLLRNVTSSSAMKNSGVGPAQAPVVNVQVVNKTSVAANPQVSTSANANGSIDIVVALEEQLAARQRQGISKLGNVMASDGLTPAERARRSFMKG